MKRPLVHAATGTTRGFELARASEALAVLSRGPAPVPSRRVPRLENALSDWRTPRTAADLGPRFPALLRAAHAGLEATSGAATFNRAPSPTSPRACVPAHRLALPPDVKRIPPALDRLHAFLCDQHGPMTRRRLFPEGRALCGRLDGPLRGERWSTFGPRQLARIRLIALSGRAPRLATANVDGRGSLSPGSAPHRFAISRRVQRGRDGEAPI